MLAGSLTFLASLYLPWERNNVFGSCSARNPLGCSAFSVDGWSIAPEAASALAAVVLVICTTAALLQPGRGMRLPIARLALLIAYLALAAWALAVNDRNYGATLGNGRLSLAYGAYLGIASAAAVLGAAAVLRRREILQRPGVVRIATVLFGAGVLLALLLPWQRISVFNHTVESLGISRDGGVVAAAVACLGVGWWRTGGSNQFLSAAALAILITGRLLAGLYIIPVPFPTSVLYGAWLGVAFSVALLALSARKPSWPVALRPPPQDVLLVGAPAALLLFALFLPWRYSCFPKHDPSVPHGYAGVCSSIDGWSTLPGTVAGALVLGLLTILLLRRSGIPSLRIALGIGLFVATAGFEIRSPFPDVRFGYGSFVGFTAAGLLLGAAASGRLRRPNGRRLLVRLLPLATCLAMLLLVVVPWWGVLPGMPFNVVSPWWMTVALALVVLNLTVSWLQRTANTARGQWLAAQAGLVLGLTALQVTTRHDRGVSWGGLLVVGLCLLLVVFGRIEERDGFGNAGFGGIWRVWEIPEPEG